MDVLAQPVELVGSGHPFVENLHGDRHQPGMGDPGAVVAALASASVLMGICAAMPPIAKAPRWWQVLIVSCEYDLKKWVVIVTNARSGSTKSCRLRNFLMKLKM